MTINVQMNQATKLELMLMFDIIVVRINTNPVSKITL